MAEFENPYYSDHTGTEIDESVTQSKDISQFVSAAVNAEKTRAEGKEAEIDESISQLALQTSKQLSNLNWEQGGVESGDVPWLPPGSCNGVSSRICTRNIVVEVGSIISYNIADGYKLVIKTWNGTDSQITEVFGWLHGSGFVTVSNKHVYVQLAREDNSDISTSYKNKVTLFKNIDLSNIEEKQLETDLELDKIKTGAIMMNKRSLFDTESRNVLSNLNLAEPNRVYWLIITSSSVPDNLPTDYPLTGIDGILEVRKAEYSAYYVISQTIKFLVDKGYYYARTYNSLSGTWGTWRKVVTSSSGTGSIVKIGPNEAYKTLREGIAAAVQNQNTDVYIAAGVYDLTKEFASEIAANPYTYYGIELNNGVRLHFGQGSYVKALVTPDENRRNNFNPFYVNGDCEIDGLNIEVSNTRYCVHDDLASKCTVRYKNCVMKNHSNIVYDAQGKPHCFYQCIGGGLGYGKYVEIVNCYLDSMMDSNSNVAAISYHNGADANADSKIFVRDCYFCNNNFLSAQWWGLSTIVSYMYACNNNLGNPIVCKAETSSSTVVNMAVREWNNTIRS